MMSHIFAVGIFFIYYVYAYSMVSLVEMICVHYGKEIAKRKFCS